MAHALPFAKLATLLIKTVAKPVSKRIKKDFSRYKPTRRLLVGIGQTNHSITSRMTIWSEGYTVRSIKPLEDEKALSNGADFVGESFILLVSMGTVVWEYNRSNEKSKAKEAKQRAQAKAERDALQANFIALDERLKAVEAVVKSNSQSILNITGPRYVEPKKTELVRIYDDDDDDDDDGNEEEGLEKQTPLRRLEQIEQQIQHHQQQKQQQRQQKQVNSNLKPDPIPVEEKPSTPWWQFW